MAAVRSKSANKVALKEIIRRVVEVAQPERIILFGSAARGTMGPNSDIDLLVVKRGNFDQRRLTGDIYMSLHGLGQAVDVVVVTPEQLERHRNTHWLVIAPALRQGREVYHSKTLHQDAAATWEADGRRGRWKGSRLDKGVKDPWAF